MTTNLSDVIPGRVHNRPEVRHGRLVRPVGAIRGYSEDFKLWSPPKLTEKGRPFKPAWGQPGSTVFFDLADGTRMSGPVWSEGPNPGSLWVVLDQVTYLVS